jgi:predicted TIM-barrel fold metal-dependent hydrolase
MSVNTPKIDCHVHIFDPERFPYTPDVFYRPSGHEIATANQLRYLLDAHDVRHAIISGPNSGYGLDNRCMLSAVAEGGGRYKGVAVVRNDVNRQQLQDLQGAGVVGIAFNVALLGVDSYRDLGPLLQRLRDLNMLAQFQVKGDQLVALQPMLLDSGAQLIFDHCGRPIPEKGLGQAGFAALLSLAETGRACVKLSGLALCSHRPFPHEDVWPFIHEMVKAYTPQFLMWASNWPFIRASARVDYGPLLAQVEQLIPTKSARDAIFWETPLRIFGFGN